MPAVLAQPSPAPIIVAVEAVGMTVSDMDRSVEFFSKVLTFEKISDVEVSGSEYERLHGVFGLRQTKLVTRKADAADHSLRARRFGFVSPGVVALPEGRLGFRRGFLVRDPDGHVIQLVEK
jgi:catechol 2,3-dioxygenase-like lactoylglutathione lyase family enzyme